MSNAKPSDAAFVPSEEEIARLLAWDRQSEQDTLGLDAGDPDFSDEQARSLALAATFSGAELDRSAARHQVGLDGA